MDSSSSLPPDPKLAESGDNAAVDGGIEGLINPISINNPPAANRGKRKRRKGGGIGRKLRGNQKNVKDSDAKGTFSGRRVLNPADMEAEVEEEEVVVIRRLQNKVQYQKRKEATHDEKMEKLGEEVAEAKEREADMGKMLEQQSKLAAAAQASADKHLTRANDMRNKFTTFYDKKAGELRAVKQSAKKKLAAMEDANSKELERQRAKSFRDSRVDAKKIVHLEGELEVQERKHTKDAVAASKQHSEELNNLAIAHQHNINELQSSSLRKERETTKALQHSIRHVQSSSYREIKAIKKDKVSLEASLAAVIVEKEQAIAINDVAVKEAVKEAQTEERLQASSKVRALSSRLNDTKTLQEPAELRHILYNQFQRCAK